jgi:hypothetical protein
VNDSLPPSRGQVLLPKNHATKATGHEKQEKHADNLRFHLVADRFFSRPNTYLRQNSGAPAPWSRQSSACFSTASSFHCFACRATARHKRGRPAWPLPDCCPTIAMPTIGIGFRFTAEVPGECGHQLALPPSAFHVPTIRPSDFLLFGLVGFGRIWSDLIGFGLIDSRNPLWRASPPFCILPSALLHAPPWPRSAPSNIFLRLSEHKRT